MSRITDPTAGSITMWGRVGSLLEVGTGFHPEFTGRDNIYLNGAILGMSRAESSDSTTSSRSPTREVPRHPVKRYSSGMYVRLAFAVAAHLEPEILLIDEVLAVGDAAFQRKCLSRMTTLAKGGRTVLFVSHNLTSVANLCSRCVYLREGTIAFDDQSPRARRLSRTISMSTTARWDRCGSGCPRLHHQRCQLLSLSGEPARRVGRATAASSR